MNMVQMEEFVWLNFATHTAGVRGVFFFFGGFRGAVSRIKLTRPADSDGVYLITT